MFLCANLTIYVFLNITISVQFRETCHIFSIAFTNNEWMSLSQQSIVIQNVSNNHFDDINGPL